jgi:hypothetical protein
MSVRREAANVLPVIAGIRDSAVQLVSILGSVVISARMGIRVGDELTRHRFVAPTQPSPSETSAAT